MIATPCYSKEELEKYLHGLAADELSGAIEIHLEECSDCEDTLCGLDASDDTLVRTLQVKSGAAVAEGPSWIEGMARSPNLDPDANATAEQIEINAPEELGDYELVDVLGRGGMSVVFAARHKHLGRQVALKVLLPTMQQSVSRERFAREMRAVGVLDHPAIVRATDAGECNETLYLVMEQIDGVDLNRISKSHGPLKIADACAIACEVARGLKHAHEQGVVHRDIKPSNIMLDASGNVKILDFGLARMQSVACDVSLQTTMGQLLGTLDYMAPEQASGADVDARADIYALGATLFKLLTGVPPHGRSAEMPIIEFLSCLATKDAGSLADHRDSLPGDLIALVAEMLRRDHADRIADLDAIESRLSRFAEDADLLRLATTAIEHREQVEDLAESKSDAVKECLTGIWPDSDVGQSDSTDPESDDAPVAVTKSERQPPANWIALATGLASLAGLILFATVIMLKTPEGEIRIETELPNINVELVDAKDHVETIGVEQGAAMTTVSTGRYRIRLDSPSDGIEVSPSEVIVKKGKTVIAKVRKIAKADALAARNDTAKDQPEKRDPLVALQAQNDLKAAQRELIVARKDPEKNAQTIKRLEAKLIELRSLSRPIPTEPVYKGRTLSDWLAQLRFEQENDARRKAAESVLELSKTRSEAERIDLLLEVGSRQLEWRGYSPLADLTQHYQQTVPKRLRAIDGELVAEEIADALRNGDASMRDYALYASLALRSEIRADGKLWAPALSSLEEHVEMAPKDKWSIAKLVYANCVPEPTDAIRLLRSIDTNDATPETLWVMLNTVEERRLPVDRRLMIDWCGAHFDKIPVQQFYRQYGSGPLVSIKWKGIDVSQQSEVNGLVQPLLKSLADLVGQLAANLHDKSLQLKIAGKTRKLSHVVHYADLTGDAKAKSVAVLNKRLKQLLFFRSSMSEIPEDAMDTPAQIATTLLLLTGEVPSAVKELDLDDTTLLAKTVATVRETLISPQGFGEQKKYVRLRSLFSSGPNGRLPGIGNNGRLGERLGGAAGNRGGSVTAWYPFELIDAVAHWLKTESAAFSEHLIFNPLLLVGSLDEHPELAKLLNAFQVQQSFGTQISEHVAFKDSIRHQMENATDQNVMKLTFTLWSSGQRESVASAMCLDWLKSKDVERVRFALNGLVTLTPAEDGNLIRPEWAKSAAEAIDRIAAQSDLNSTDISHLCHLKDKAPNAARHAADYLKSYLGSEERREKERKHSIAENRGRQPNSSLLSSALKILKRDVEGFTVSSEDLPKSLSKRDLNALQPFLR